MFSVQVQRAVCPKNDASFHDFDEFERLVEPHSLKEIGGGGGS